MDLLGSILGSMEKPPTIAEPERKKVKAQKDLLEKQQDRDRKRLQEFREKIQKQIHGFIKDATQQKLKLAVMDKTCRSIVHEVADIASLASFSFGIEEEDRYVMVWKKEFSPSDEELLAYRREEEWDPEKSKALLQQREKDRREAEYVHKDRRTARPAEPATNYQDKYKHLIGETSAKDAAHSTLANRSYGNVPSENKMDQRTIEQVLADTRARKKLKTEHNASQSQPSDCSHDAGDIPSNDNSSTNSTAHQCSVTTAESDTSTSGT